MSRITIDRDQCKGCGLCVTACPKKILQIGTKLNSKGYAPAEQLHSELCTGCAFCALLCPDCVITVIKGEE